MSTSCHRSGIVLTQRAKGVTRPQQFRDLLPVIRKALENVRYAAGHAAVPSNVVLGAACYVAAGSTGVYYGSKGSKNARAVEATARLGMVRLDPPSDFRIADPSVQDVDFRILGSAGAELYSQVRWYSLDRDEAPSVDDIVVGTVGPRVKF
jgi:hypothetical protein